MLGILGKKIGMTNVYDDEGLNIPCTVIQAGPCVVTQIKTEETDGYSAVQLGLGVAKEKNTAKPQLGHFKKANTTPKRILKEFRDMELDGLELGKELNISDVFEEGDFIDVTAKSKGKGFQGVVKRHGFGGVGQSTHGQHNRQRHPGSIGACSYPSRVFKGLRMAGHMGNRKVTVQNLRIIKILAEDNLLVISGAVPGHKNAFLTIKK